MVGRNIEWMIRKRSPLYAMTEKGRGVFRSEWGPRAGPHLASPSLVTGNGSIDADELRTVLQSCLQESSISLPDEKLDQLTLALFESADKDCSGDITFEELRDELQHFPGVMENLTIRYGLSLAPSGFYTPGVKSDLNPSVIP